MNKLLAIAIGSATFTTVPMLADYGRDYPMGRYYTQGEGIETMENSDDEVTRNISDLLRSQGDEYDLVTFTINKGNVVLQGSVDSLNEKMKIEKAIRDIRGVRSLNSQLIVRNRQTAENRYGNPFPQDYASSETDRELNLLIRRGGNAIGLWDRYYDVRLSTENGEVTLEGIVNSSNDQQKLLNAIQRIEGVKRVRSNLTMRNNNNY